MIIISLSAADRDYSSFRGMINLTSDDQCCRRGRRRRCPARLRVSRSPLTGPGVTARARARMPDSDGHSPPASHSHAAGCAGGPAPPPGPHRRCTGCRATVRPAGPGCRLPGSGCWRTPVLQLSLSPWHPGPGLPPVTRDAESDWHGRTSESVTAGWRKWRPPPPPWHATVMRFGQIRESHGPAAGGGVHIQ